MHWKRTPMGGDLKRKMASEWIPFSDSAFSDNFFTKGSRGVIIRSASAEKGLSSWKILK